MELRSLVPFVTTKESFSCACVCFLSGESNQQVTGCRSLFHQHKKHPKHSQKPTLGPIRLKQKFSGLRPAFKNVQDTPRIGETMTSDLQIRPAVACLYACTASENQSLLLVVKQFLNDNRVFK